MASLIPGARFAPLESNNHLLLATEPAWLRWRDEVRAFVPAEPAADPLFAKLTPRERELVELIAQGCDNAQIGARQDQRDGDARQHDAAQVFGRGVAVPCDREPAQLLPENQDQHDPDPE